MIEKSIRSAINKMKQRGWDRIYFLVDIHDTIFKATYNEIEKYEWLGQAKEALQKLTETPWIILILWSSSYDNTLKDYIKYFEKNNIRFDYINENPEVENGSLGCFDKKPYFNVILDDKAGFSEEDWTKIIQEI